MAQPKTKMGLYLDAKYDIDREVIAMLNAVANRELRTLGGMARVLLTNACKDYLAAHPDVDWQSHLLALAGR